MSQLSDKFAAAWNEFTTGLPFVPEHRFHPTRRWRFDFAWPELKVAVEVNGYGYGHLTVAQVANDAEKQRAATELGWRVLVFTSKCLGSVEKRRDAVQQVYAVLSGVTNESEAEG